VHGSIEIVYTRCKEKLSIGATCTGDRWEAGRGGREREREGGLMAPAHHQYH
jgi:hypothetical protein